jgi:hypothetical protein
MRPASTSRLLLAALLAAAAGVVDAQNASNASTPAPPAPPPPPFPPPPPCPTTTTATSCYVGSLPASINTLAYTSGGGCRCLCGAAALTADYDYKGAAYLLPQTNASAVTFAAFPAVCTPSMCRSSFPAKCGSANYVNTTFQPYSAYLTATPNTSTWASPGPVVKPAGTVCISYMARCSVNRSVDACPLGLTTGNVTIYGAINSSSCPLFMAQVARYAPFVTVYQACGTSACNAPSSPPPPLPPPPSPPPPSPPSTSGGVRQPGALLAVYSLALLISIWLAP